MKKILLIIAILCLPIVAFAISGQNDRFDFSLGQPTITADGTSACTDTAVARFDFVLGQPAIVHDATANCTLAVAEAGGSPTYKLIIPSEYKQVIPSEYIMIIQ